MRVFVTCMMALGLAAMPALAGTARPGDDASSTPKSSDAAAAKSNDATATKAKSTDTNAANSKTDATSKTDSSTMENELQQLRELIEAQSRLLQSQSDQLKAQQEKMKVLEDRLNSAAAPNASVATNPAPESSSSSSSLGSSISIPPGGAASTVAVSNASSNPANTNGSASAQEMGDNEPAAIHIKGITLTPGGFMAAETVWRGKALGSDINTPFSSLPVPGASNSNLSEFFGSGRQSRISMLVEGKLSSVKIGGYYETDFLSSGVTSNNNASNSYTMRQRQFWAQAAFDSGWKITGGQMWSLVTETKNGLDNRTEATPMTIDANYNIGFSWARQYAFRITKSFGNTFFLGFAVENPQATLTAHGNLANALLGSVGTTGGLYDNQSNYSFNASPDIVVKAALQPSWGHFEVFGVAERFRDRIFPCGGIAATATCSLTPTTVGPSSVGATDDAAGGGGVGANARISVLEKHVDFGLHFMAGNGIGRYASGGLSDATLRPDGTLALLRGYHGLATIEIHYPKFDIYMNGGGEYASRAAYSFIPPGGTTAVAEGYGNPLFSNSGCYTEAPPGSTNGFVPGTVGGCTADTRALFEGTVGFWYRFYKGPKGTIQWGPQFSYVVRNTWAGTAASNGVTAPSIDEPMFLTSFRYYLP